MVLLLPSLNPIGLPRCEPPPLAGFPGLHFPSFELQCRRDRGSFFAICFGIVASAAGDHISDQTSVGWSGWTDRISATRLTLSVWGWNGIVLFCFAMALVLWSWSCPIAGNPSVRALWNLDFCKEDGVDEESIFILCSGTFCLCVDLKYVWTKNGFYHLLRNWFW